MEENLIVSNSSGLEWQYFAIVSLYCHVLEVYQLGVEQKTQRCVIQSFLFGR